MKKISFDEIRVNGKRIEQVIHDLATETCYSHDSDFQSEIPKQKPNFRKKFFYKR